MALCCSISCSSIEALSWGLGVTIGKDIEAASRTPSARIMAIERQFVILKVTAGVTACTSADVQTEQRWAWVLMLQRDLYLDLQRCPGRRKRVEEVHREIDPSRRTHPSADLFSCGALKASCPLLPPSGRTHDALAAGLRSFPPHTAEWNEGHFCICEICRRKKQINVEGILSIHTPLNSGI